VNQPATIERPASEARQVSGGLEVRSIAKSYERRAVLHDVSLDVHRGEVVGFSGLTAPARRPASIRSWAW